MRKSRLTSKIQAQRESGRKAGLASGDARRRRREWLAKIDPVRLDTRIVMRVVIIWKETTVREIVRYAWETERDWKRKKREAGL